MRHNDISADSRARASKRNKHIDTSRSKYNFSILGGSKGLSYAEMAKKYDDRIAYLDSHGNTNKRRDRVSMFSVEIPVPIGLERNHYVSWFMKVSEILRERYGEENFIDGTIHYDEEHEYVEPETREKVWSRVHGHFMFVPELNGKLNAKKLTSRSNIIALNKAVEEMTRREFGCAFMTGSKKKSFKTVEELKTMSAYAEYEMQIEEQEKEIEKKREQVRIHREVLERREREIEEKEAQAKDMMAKAEAAYREALRREEKAREKLQAAEDAGQHPQEEKTRGRRVSPELEMLFQKWERQRLGLPEPDMKRAWKEIERRRPSAMRGDSMEMDAAQEARAEEKFNIPFEFRGLVSTGVRPSDEDEDEDENEMGL